MVNLSATSQELLKCNILPHVKLEFLPGCVSSQCSAVGKEVKGILYDSPKNCHMVLVTGLLCRAIIKCIGWNLSLRSIRMPLR